MLNAKRRNVLRWTAVTVLAMLIYPPTQFRGVGRGYDWIFAMESGLTVNASQLLVQWVAVAILAGIAMALMDDESAVREQLVPPMLLGLLSKFNPRAIVIPLLRTVRIPVTLFGWWQCMGALMLLARLISAARDPSEDIGKVGANLLALAVTATLLVGLSALLRKWINHLHRELNGCDHPDLPKWWRL